MTCHARRLPLVALTVVCAAAALAPAYAADCKLFFADRLLSRKNHDLHLISNLPEEWLRTNVLRNVTAVATNGAPELAMRLKLHPLADLGGPGATWKGLLPFDPLKNAQTILILDGATMTDAEREALKRLRAELFAQVVLPKEEEAYWIGQNGGGPATAKKAAGSHQLLLVAPSLPGADAQRDDHLLRALLDELWAWPGCDSKKPLPPGQPEILDGSGRANVMAHHVRRIAVATNDPAARVAIAQGFSQPFDVLRSFPVDPDLPEAVTAFGAVQDVEARLVALNWNGEKELSADFCRKLLPAKMVDDAVAQPTDPRDLDGWQQFSYKLTVAQDAGADGPSTAYVLAPTTRHLEALLRQAYDPRAAGAPRVPTVLGDLSWITKLAVGPYFLDRNLPRERLLAQRRLEETVQSALADKGVELVANLDLGELLAQVVTPGATTTMPDDGRQRLHNAAKADGLLILYVQELKGGQRSEVTPLNRRTPDVMGPFTESKPDGPNCKPGHPKPHPCDDCKARHRQKVREWEHDQERWDDERENLRVTWYFDEMRFPWARYDGDLRLIDLVAGRSTWNARLTTDGRSTETMRRTLERTVEGDETDCPPAPAGQPPTHGFDEAVMPAAQQSLDAGLAKGLSAFVMENVFRGDIKPWNIGTSITWGDEFILTLQDGTEKRGQLPTPVAITERGQRVELPTADLAARLKGRDAQPVQFAGSAVPFRTADKDEKLQSSTVATIKLPPPPPPEELTSHPYAVSAGDQTAAGPLPVRQKLVVQTKLGDRTLTPAELEQLEEITVADTGGATIKLEGGAIITGTITSPTLTVHVGEENRQIDWQAIKQVVRDVAIPLAAPFGLELQDGTKKNGVFTDATVAVNEYPQPLKVSDIQTLARAAAGGWTVTLRDGDVLTVTFKEPAINVQWEGAQQPVALPWQDLKSVGEAVKPPEVRLHKVNTPLVDGGVEYAPLSDLLVATGHDDLPAKLVGGAYEVLLPSGKLRFRAEATSVYVGVAAQKVLLPPQTRVIVRANVIYFPVAAIAPLWGYKVEPADKGFLCTKPDDAVVIQTRP